MEENSEVEDVEAVQLDFAEVEHMGNEELGGLRDLVFNCGKEAD